ncbi:MAG: antibiotic biosynthesis monooxygenase [Chloroflexi bacterium]|nr:antibiotic biosynthesis monooxygenase [Chloroflexota bacterium]MBU1750450.1 antibiotic biosynthesis monooxygenase [Chloroflexota bacterium]
MAYVYHIDFDIRPGQMSELAIGTSLERILGYLRALLPSQPGHITTRVLRSVDIPDRTHLIVQSMWETWGDLQRHRQSSLAEDKVLTEFQPHVALADLTVHVYEELD